ncbi:MAG: DUF1697 domain-containing protein [Longimicrobiales bacterium]
MVYLALLRAVNLGSHNKVAMGDLRTLLTDLGFSNAQSLLQSGNLVFEAANRSTDALELELERAAAERLGLVTDVFVRTRAEWRAIVDANPFLEESRNDPGHLVVSTMKEAPKAARLSALESAISGREAVHAVERQLYAVYPDGIGRSRLTTALIEKHLGTRVTGRNWNTVLKLAALVGS